MSLGAESSCNELNKLDTNNTASDIGEWYISEDLNLAYSSVFASDSVPSDTSTDVDADPGQQ